MTKTKWPAYNDLAWTDLVLSSPEECKEEIEYFAKLIKDFSRIEAGSLLHLGCGAGFYDFTFKRHFRVTGVDLSEGMLKIARKLNPEVTYLRGDMRNFSLKERFDVVAIPESIGYMVTESELREAVKNAQSHLKPGGVLLIAVLVREDYRNNNFIYTGSGGDIEVTLLENNYAVDPGRLAYESVMVYLIRRKGRLEIKTDRHTLGLFPLGTWRSLLLDAGLEVKEFKLEHSYDDNICGEGEYTQRIFICRQLLLAR